MGQLDPNGERHLAGVHPDLVRVVRKAVDLCPIRFTCTEGARSVAAEEEAIRTGHSSLKDPRSSKHVVGHDGWGHAVDLAPLIHGQPSWAYLPPFTTISKSMKQAAAELKIPIEWGGDWKTFIDRPHFQLPNSKYPR